MKKPFKPGRSNGAEKESKFGSKKTSAPWKPGPEKQTGCARF
jgi:hypothetical protein